MIGVTSLDYMWCFQILLKLDLFVMEFKSMFHIVVEFPMAV